MENYDNKKIGNLKRKKVLYLRLRNSVVVFAPIKIFNVKYI